MSGIPERIGHYRVESSLGRGGMGEVFLAWDERLRRRVALKRLRADVADSPASRERFRREAFTAAELSHPGTVHVYDLVEETDGDYLVMEYVPGDSLARRLAGGPLSVAETLRFGRQIAEGLAAAHAAGLVHRDLKADNVILTDKGEAKILDFGLARHVYPLPDETSLTQRGFVVGTYHAMSPEQATGVAVDERSDLFSLGSLLAEMLTGKPPFKGDTPAATLKRVLTQDPPPVATLRSGVPASLSTLIARLLAKEPADRPGSAELVARTLRDIAVNHHGDSEALAPTISELPTGVVPRGRAKPAGWRRWWVYGAVGVAIAGLGTGYVFWPRAPLRVLVAPPKVSPVDDSALQLAATSALLQVLDALRQLKGIEVLDPLVALTKKAREKGDIREMAEESAADEVFLIDVARGETEKASFRLSARRSRADSTSLWSPKENYRILPLDEGDLIQINEPVLHWVQEAYEGHRRRAGTGESGALTARPEDYLTYVEVRKRLNFGETGDRRSELKILQGVIKESARFQEALLLAAGFSINLFEAERLTHDRDRARKLIAEVRNLAPKEPRALDLGLELALLEGKVEDAARLLEVLIQLRPGYPALFDLRASVAEAQGDVERAVAIRQRESELYPSWRAYYNLAALAMRTGRKEEARSAVAESQRLWDANLWSLRNRVEFELRYGDAAKAEAESLKLVEETEDVGAVVNLGLSLYLQGRYHEAISRYLEADQASTTYAVLIGLADAKEALEHREAARKHYEGARGLLAEDVADSPETRMAMAQCLAHLGKETDAVTFAEEAAKERPHDPMMALAASLVYARTGNYTFALRDSQKALKSGLAEHWFKIPTMKPVWDDPDFQAALRARQEPSSSP